MRRTLIGLGARCLILSMGVVSCSSQFKITPDMKMGACLLQINAVQNEIHTRSERFGTLEEVMPLVGRRFSNDTALDCARDYNIKLEVRSDGYSLYANPINWKAARRSFYMNQTGVIRVSWGPEAANEHSAVQK